jgi:hypothetical protein
MLMMDTMSFDAYHASESFVFSLGSACLCALFYLLLLDCGRFAGLRHGLGWGNSTPHAPPYGFLKDKVLDYLSSSTTATPSSLLEVCTLSLL